MIDLPRLTLLWRAVGSGEQRTVHVRFIGLRVDAGMARLTVGIQCGDLDKSFHEEHPTILGLFECVLHTVVVVMDYGLWGRRGRDYDLFTEDGRPWEPLRHLRLKVETP